MGVAYSKFGVVALKAIQELRSEKDIEIQALRIENESLKATLKALTADVETGNALYKATEARLAKLEEMMVNNVKDD